MIVATVSVAAQMATDGGNSAPVIRALEHAWFDGEARNDNRALDLIFDNALVYIEYGKVMTKGEYLARVKAVTPQPQQVAMESMTVRTFNGTAIVVGIYREKGVTDGENFPSALAVCRYLGEQEGALDVGCGRLLTYAEIKGERSMERPPTGSLQTPPYSGIRRIVEQHRQLDAAVAELREVRWRRGLPGSSVEAVSSGGKSTSELRNA